MLDVEPGPLLVLVVLHIGPFVLAAAASFSDPLPSFFSAQALAVFALPLFCGGFLLASSPVTKCKQWSTRLSFISYK